MSAWFLVVSDCLFYFRNILPVTSDTRRNILVPVTILLPSAPVSTLLVIRDHAFYSFVHCLEKPGSDTSKDSSSSPEVVIDAVRTIAQKTIAPPSVAALQEHIRDLETELRNIDFRLQHFYYQRTGITTSLIDTKVLLEKVQETFQD